MKSYLVCLFVLIGFASAEAQEITGRWKTIDDETGNERSIVEIFERQGKYFGKIIKIFPAAGEEPDPVCNECPEDDSRYKRKIIGMEILRDLEKKEESYDDGNILDPKNGKIYRCKLWMDGPELKVRGYWGPFFRTQTWKRVS
jgi:uncharacterized protein (DUF2147 family)